MCVDDSVGAGSLPGCYPIQPAGVNRREPISRGYDGSPDGLPTERWPSSDAVWQMDRVCSRDAGAGRPPSPA